MPKHIFEFPCPCCGKRIEVNARNGKARAVSCEDAEKGKSLDGLVEDQKREGQRLGSLFDEAREDQDHSEQHLDDMFKQAAEESKKDKGKRPVNPFDLE